MLTTLNAIRSYNPCTERWKKLLAHLGKSKADGEPLSILDVLNSNGLDDALWCLRAVEGHDREISMFTVWCARQVQHLMADRRSLAALDIAERCANGAATRGELIAAWDAARAAAQDAQTAAQDAQAAAWAALGAAWAARGPAQDARAAAWAAAGAARAAAAGAAAWDAAWAAQERRLREICLQEVSA